MNTSQRVLVNTIAVYFRQVFLLIISLVTVPMILGALGEIDYGVYNLVAGVIAMLSFLNASMTISTQRFLSVAIGENNTETINKIYNNSVLLHGIIGLLVVLLFEIGFFILFNSDINVPTARVHAAKVVYQTLVISTFFTIIKVPFTSVMNAKEHMITLSLFGIIDSLLKLGLAYVIAFVAFDKLIFYGLGIAAITLLIGFLEIAYVMVFYKDLSLNLNIFFDKTILFRIAGFCGWNTFGAVAMIGRNQGIAIIMNLFYGPVANAAYGIANQINGALSYFSGAFQGALNPQLMKSEGMKDQERLVKISFLSSKMSVFVTALFAIPLILEMPYVLRVWLTDVPEHTLQLAQFVLCLLIVYQYSVGLMSAIQAKGNIRNYFLIISGLILLNLPVCYYVLKFGAPLYYCIIVFILIECFSLITRLLLAKKYVGIKPLLFVKKVMVPTMLTVLCSFFPAIVIHHFLPQSFLRLVLVSAAYLIVYACVGWTIVLDDNVKQTLIGIVKKMKRKTTSFHKSSIE